MSRPAAMPYVIGQWVSGKRFYGRRRLLAEAGQGWHWIAGLRRMGKTSLLKQLELEAMAAPSRESPIQGSPRACLPLFWDLQGVDSAEEAAYGFADALLDAEESLERLSIDPMSLEGGDLVAMLERLGRALREMEGELLLLCDEADEWVAVERQEPGLAARVWSTIQGIPGARVVITSSVRMARSAGSDGVASDGVGSNASLRAWVKPFAEPSFLSTLNRRESLSLVQQDQLPIVEQPAIPQGTAEALASACGGHPMLLQIACKRYLEVGDVEQALELLAADRAVGHMLSVDFALLTSEERQILLGLARGKSLASPIPSRLAALGLVVEQGHGPFLANRIFADWLRQQPEDIGLGG